MSVSQSQSGANTHSQWREANEQTLNAHWFVGLALIILLLTFVTLFGVGLSYVVQGGLRFIFTLTPQCWNSMCMSKAGSSNSSLILSTTRFLTRACSLLQGFSCAYLHWKDVYVRAQFQEEGLRASLSWFSQSTMWVLRLKTQVVKLGGRPLKQLPFPNTCSVPERNTWICCTESAKLNGPECVVHRTTAASGRATSCAVWSGLLRLYVHQLHTFILVFSP